MAICRLEPCIAVGRTAGNQRRRWLTSGRQGGCVCGCSSFGFSLLFPGFLLSALENSLWQSRVSKLFALGLSEYIDRGDNLSPYGWTQELQRLKSLPSFRYLNIRNAFRAVRSGTWGGLCVTAGEVILDLHHCTEYNALIFPPLCTLQGGVFVHGAIGLAASMSFAQLMHEWCALLGVGAGVSCGLTLVPLFGQESSLIFSRHTLYRLIKGPWLLSLWCMHFLLWFSSPVTHGAVKHPCYMIAYSPHPFTMGINLLSCISLWFPSVSTGLEHRRRWKEASCKVRHDPWKWQGFSKGGAVASPRLYPGTGWKWCVRGRYGYKHSAWWEITWKLSSSTGKYVDLGGKEMCFPQTATCVGVTESLWWLRKLVNPPTEQECLGMSLGKLHRIREFANYSTPGYFCLAPSMFFQQNKLFLTPSLISEQRSNYLKYCTWIGKPPTLLKLQ